MKEHLEKAEEQYLETITKDNEDKSSLEIKEKENKNEAGKDNYLNICNSCGEKDHETYNKIHYYNFFRKMQ